MRRRLDRRHDIRARGQVLELVEPIGIRHHACDHRDTGGIPQLYGHARQSDFAGVLDAIAIVIPPNAVAEARRLLLIPEIHGIRHLARCERHHRRTGRAHAIQVVGRNPSGRNSNRQRVGARGKVGERVIPIGIGRRGLPRRQRHRRARQSGLAGVLHTVGIRVHPDAVTQATARIPEVDVIPDLVHSQGYLSLARRPGSIEVVCRQVTSRSQHHHQIVSSGKTREGVGAVGICQRGRQQRRIHR